ncbi:MAG: sortase [Clostridia bacterium]|nr:sortase [Clostridia bacterium]
MTKGKKIGVVLMVCGVLSFFGAIGLVGYNSYTEYRAEKTAVQVISVIEKQQDSVVKSEDLLPDYVVNPDMDMPFKIVEGKEYVGKVDIWSKNLSLPVINNCTTVNLKYSPCRYEGTPYKNNFIIAAHNYRGQFAELKNLVTGDKITFTDMDGNVFNYEVMYTDVLDKTDVGPMSEGDWDLTLFTCTYGGATRVTVRCKLINN